MMKKIFTILFFVFISSLTRAAIITVGTGTSYASTSGVSAFNLARPSGINIGDLLVVQINLNTSSVTVSAPSGWTQLRVDTNSGSGSDNRQYIFYRVATLADTTGGTTAWSTSSSVFAAAGMVAFRSDLGGRSIVLDTHTVNSGTNATLTGASITASAPGLLLRFFGYARGTTSFASSGINRLVDATTSGTTGGATLLFASRTLNSAGASGSDTVTAANSARWLVQTLLLTESAPSKPANCYGDSFSSSTTFGQNWVTTSVGSTSFTPTVIGGRLRLTSNNGYISTAATLQRIFPTSNLIYVEFDYYAYPNANGADGIAVTLSDASITPQPGGFGGSLGYAQRNDSGGINGFAGGWVGIALDEYGNYSNPTEGRNGGPGFRVDSVAIRGSGSGQTGYPYLAGTAAGLSPGVDSSSTPGPGHRYRIVIDAAAPGQTYVTVDRDTTGSGSSYVNLIPTFNIESSASQATIPANLMLSFTGSTGGSSNTHEIGDLSVCATTIDTTNQVDHFEFTHDGQGLTCEAENVTIRACADASCSTLMSVPVTVNLNPSGGWGSNPVTFTGSTTLQLRQTTAGTAAISVASSSPGTRPFSTNRCNGVNTNTCNLPFANAGLEFDVPNVLANRPSGPVRLRAVRNSGDASNSCVPLFQNTTQSINFWSAYTTPNTGTRAVELRAGSGAGAFTNISGNSVSPTALSLDFNANGETTFEARYNDAGLMLLNARYNGSGTYAGLILNGSDSFVSTPAGFCIRTPDPNNSNNSLTCTTNYSACPVFRNAGNTFPLIISAVGWESDTDANFCSNNSITPNYVQNNINLTSRVVAPVAANPDDNINGIVAPTTFNIAAGAGGIVTLNNVTESEVGVFEFVAAPPQNQYQGVTMPSGNNLSIGRFIPHHFAIVPGSLINRASSSCISTPAFTYLNEALNLEYQIIAQNASNVRTENYHGAFAKLFNLSQTDTRAIVPSPRASLTPLSATATPDPVVVNWLQGQGDVVASLMVAKSAAPIGPFTSTAFGVRPTDSDGVTTTGIAAPAPSTSLLPLNLDTNIPADNISDHAQIGSTTELRYGRLRLDSVSGPANLPLAIPITTEYWNGVGFIANTADSNCTPLAINNATVPLGPYSGNLNNGETSILNSNGFIVSGRAPSVLQLSAPGNGNEGSVGLTLDTSLWPWLQFDWNGDGSLDTTATASASFGTYRGSDRVIYWLEIQ